MSGHAPGVLCRVKPPKNIPKWEYDQTNERIVELISFDPSQGKWDFEPRILVKHPGGFFISVIKGAIPSCLVPINPGDAPDETLTWAGLPNKVKEKV